MPEEKEKLNDLLANVQLVNRNRSIMGYSSLHLFIGPACIFFVIYYRISAWYYLVFLAIVLLAVLYYFYTILKKSPTKKAQLNINEIELIYKDKFIRIPWEDVKWVDKLLFDYRIRKKNIAIKVSGDYEFGEYLYFEIIGAHEDCNKLVEWMKAKVDKEVT